MQPPFISLSPGFQAAFMSRKSVEGVSSQGIAQKPFTFGEEGKMWNQKA